MKTIKFGLMEKETQEFMGFHEEQGYRDALSMHSPKRFETDNIREIVDFIKAEKDRFGSFRSNDGYDPAEFTPVAFIHETGAFSESLVIKELVLPEIHSIHAVSTRSFNSMPAMLRKRYIPEELLNTIPEGYVDFILVHLAKDQVLKKGDYVYGGRYSPVAGDVLFAGEVPESWPFQDPTSDVSDVRLLLVHIDGKALQAACSLSEIEPLSSKPKL